MKAVKNILMLSSLFSCVSVYAGLMGNICEGQDITIPCLSPSWGVSGDALYLQSSNDGFQVLPAYETSSGRLELSNSNLWHWGFHLAATYVWETSNDFQFHWYNFRNTQQQLLSAPVYLGTIPENDFSSINEFSIDKVNASHGIQWDQINLEFGQTIDLNDSIQFRPHADLEITRIAQSMHVRWGGSSLEKGIFLNDQQSSASYSSLGPRMGALFSYTAFNGLGFDAQAAMGLLVGTAKSSFNDVDYINKINTILAQSSAPVVTHFDGQLGGHLRMNSAQGLFEIQYGWVWNHYSQALQNAAGDFSDFSIQGVYLGMKWLGSIA